ARLRAGQRIAAVNIHRARSANALAAGTAQGQRGIYLVLDPQKRIEDHRPAIVLIDEIGVDTGVLVIIRRPAIDPVFANIRRAFRLWPGLPLLDPGVLR